MPKRKREEEEVESSEESFDFEEGNLSGIEADDEEFGKRLVDRNLRDGVYDELLEKLREDAVKKELARRRARVEGGGDGDGEGEAGPSGEGGQEGDGEVGDMGDPITDPEETGDTEIFEWQGDTKVPRYSMLPPITLPF